MGRDGHGGGAEGEEEERREDEEAVEVDAAQPERQRQRRPRQRVVRAPEHPRVAALLPVLGRLRRPVQPAVRAHLGDAPRRSRRGAESEAARRRPDPSGAARVSAAFGAASGGPAPEAVGSGGGAAPEGHGTPVLRRDRAGGRVRARRRDVDARAGRCGGGGLRGGRKGVTACSWPCRGVRRVSV